MNHVLTLHKGCAVCASEQQNPYSLGVEYQLSEEHLIFAQFILRRFVIWAIKVCSMVVSPVPCSMAR